MNGFHIAFQIDGTHWLVIFIHPNGIVHAVMESDDLIDVIQDQANSAPQ
ncbi:hypothetical protein FHX08_004761 [Rhizobium sp. BK529]|nr:hypothetical protein [Rhizobium sp. BK529]MBB3594357.1 hypothetical protein [Rhizobium sp. BK529]